MKYDVRAILEGLGYTIPEPAVYEHMAAWRDWYQGHCAKFHDYLQYNGRKKIKRRRKSLRMAKKICEDHANLLLNEKVAITLSSPAAQEQVDAVLTANQFRVRANKLLEIAFALGAGAFVEHDDGAGGVTIDYVRGDMIYPLNWTGENITDCAFASVKSFKGRSFVYLNLHELQENGYKITNKLVPVDAEGNVIMQNLEGPATKTAKGVKLVAKEEPADPETGLLFGDMAPTFETGSTKPRFQIFGPNQVNNIDIGSPLGISVFANSIDLLEGIDLVYDSYCNEFRLGKKRIMIPQSMLQVMADGDDTFMAFDDNDTEFYGLKMDGDAKNELHEINMTLRITDHDQGLQRFLNLLSTKTGLGNDRYSFDAGVVKTATEVVSDKSELYQNLQKNELVIEATLKGMIEAIAEIVGVPETFEITINFDDSIIEDTDAKRTRMQALVTQGKFPLWRFLHEYEGYSKKDAKEIAEEAEAAMAPEELDFPEGAPGDEEPPSLLQAKISTLKPT